MSSGRAGSPETDGTAVRCMYELIADVEDAGGVLTGRGTNSLVIAGKDDSVPPGFGQGA